jgi:hypothetical protein
LPAASEVAGWFHQDFRDPASPGSRVLPREIEADSTSGAAVDR